MMAQYLEKKLPFLVCVRAYKSSYLKGVFTLVWVDLINVLLPLIVKEAIDLMISRNLKGIYLFAMLYLLLMSLQSVGRYWWRIFLIGTSHIVAKELRENIFSHLQKLPLRYYQRVRTGDLMSRCTNDVEAVRMAIGPGVLVAVDALILFVLIVPVMFYLSPKLSLMAFACYPIVPWLTKKVGGKIDTLFSTIQIKLSELSGFTQEVFNAIRLIKSCVLEGRTADRFRDLSDELRVEGLGLAKYEAIFSPTLSFITQMGTFLILLIGGFDVVSGAITVGTFIAFQRFVVQLAWPMEAIGWAITLNREGGAAYRRLDDILAEKPRQDFYKIPNVTKKNGGLLFVKNIRFSFTDSVKTFEMDLRDLKIEKGQKVGIVGPVGAGKSTLLNLILRLHEPDPSSIFFEGEDILNLPLSVIRTEIASVEQQVFLFSESIRANTVLGIEDSSPTEEEIGMLSRVASIDNEIAELDRKHHTVLGERGVNLSGGQKQRVAFLRALARKPKLLLLDDCFAAVDVKVESQIIDRFFKDYSPLSVMFVSHRMSVMPRMDQIWVMNEGKCIATGGHSELLETCQLYRSLWSQAGSHE